MYSSACSQLNTQKAASLLVPQRNSYSLAGENTGWDTVWHSTPARSSKEMGLEQHPHPAVNICCSCWCYRDGRIRLGAACKFGTGQNSCCLLPVPSQQPQAAQPCFGCAQTSQCQNERRWRGLVLCNPLKWGLSVPKTHSNSSGHLHYSRFTASLEEAVHPCHSCWASCSCLTCSFCQGLKGDRLGRVKSSCWWYRLDRSEMAWCEQNRTKKNIFLELIAASPPYSLASWSWGLLICCGRKIERG